MNKNYNKYVDTIYLIKKLEEELDLPFFEILEKVKKSNIQIEEQEVGKYFYGIVNLDYLNKCILILKNKCITLLELILKLANNNINDIESELKNLDIILNKRGKILYSDIIRLTKPTIYNINTLFCMVKMSSEKETYMTEFNLLDFVKEYEVFLYDEYPSTLLQFKNINYVKKGFINLTNNQIEESKKRIETKVLRLNKKD